MKEKDLQFDRTKHVCYSKVGKTLVLDYLNKHYPAEEVEPLFEKVQLQFVEFLKDTPYLGGKQCRHNQAGGTYDCFLLFALYEVLDHQVTMDEMYEMVNAGFLPSFEKLGKVFNLNTPWVLKLMQRVFKAVEKQDQKTLERGAEGYITVVEPFDEEQGIRYHFDRCPIAEFAKKHGYLAIMPAFCNGDYPAMELVHGGLIRRHTCANSDICDYQIVGDKSSVYTENPCLTDEKGYFYNQ